MKLLADVGNTAAKLALADLHGHIRGCTEQQIDWQSIEEVIYACVGKPEPLVALLENARQGGIPCVEAKVSAHLGHFRCGYANFATLGIDRWLAVIAAASAWPNENLVVIDAGTATTVDLINKEGQHLGGWILPGLDLMVTSLTARTQKVFDDENTPFHNEPGASTPAALKNGALVATLGAVELGKNHFGGEKVRTITAGGYGELLHRYLPQSIFVEQLVFEGLLKWRELSGNLV